MEEELNKKHKKATELTERPFFNEAIAIYNEISDYTNLIDEKRDYATFVFIQYPKNPQTTIPNKTIADKMNYAPALEERDREFHKKLIQFSLFKDRVIIKTLQNYFSLNENFDGNYLAVLLNNH